MPPNTSLPVWNYRDKLVQAIRDHKILVILGETGSGKTTQIPQYILESLPECQNIAVTQPRRIAAITVARRVAEEVGCRLGDRVGYTVRFDDCVSSRTHLRYMTDGVLLREAVEDSTLQRYDVVIIDEAHERTLDTDVLFGLLKRARHLRPELRVLIMSATLDAGKFSDFHDECPVFSIPGKTFPIEILHHAESKLSSLRGAFVQRAVETALHIHQTEKPGDVLVFLTGSQEIEQACSHLRALEENIDYREKVAYYNEVRGLEVLPVYGSLETIEQRAIFDPARQGYRKVVFATNIAQTSVTIPNIRYVIDSGFVKQKTYDPQTGMDALLMVPISQAAATQRAGRAGRTQPGKVYRLYSREALETMDDENIPEIKRSSLVGVVLSLKVMGIMDVHHFEFLDPPDPSLVSNALRQLFLLDALTAEGIVTPLGKLMAIFPLPPNLSKALIVAAKDWDCSEEMLTIVAVLASEELYVHPRSDRSQLLAAHERAKFHHSTGDHLTLYRIYTAWAEGNYTPEWCRNHYFHFRALTSARKIRAQLQEICRSVGLPIISAKIKNAGKKYVHEHDAASCRSGIRRASQYDDNGQIYHAPKHYRHCHDRRSVSPAAELRSQHDRRRSASPDVDPRPILRALCSAYYMNTAKRHSTRALFYHYASSADFLSAIKAKPSSPSLSSAPAYSHLALHVSPVSALDPHAPTNTPELEWLIYHDVTISSNRPVMRYISRVQKEWLLDDLKRIAHVNIEKLAAGRITGNECRQEDGNVEEADAPSDIPDAEKVAEKKRKRQQEIEAAKRRYLERKRK